MKKITILALHDGVGGAEKYISSLCEMLNQEFEIEIIFTYKSKDKVYEFPKAKLIYLINDISNRKEFLDYVKKHKWFKCLKEGIKSCKLLYLKNTLNKKVIKKINSDYIITTRPFHSKLVSKYASSKTIKIATEHNYHDNTDKYVKKLLSSIKNFDYLILVSKELKNFYKQLTQVKCVYIPNTCDLTIHPKSTLDANVITCIGRLNPEKGFMDLIDIIKLVKEKINIKVNLIGDGPEKDKIKEKIEANNLTSTISLLGFLNSEDIAKYLQKSSLLIMTSYTESFGIVLLEAMEAGVLPLAFDSAKGACEVLEEDKDLLVSHRNKKAMADKIIFYLNNKNVLKKKVKSNNKRLTKYKMDKVKEMWKQIIK